MEKSRRDFLKTIGITAIGAGAMMAKTSTEATAAGPEFTWLMQTAWTAGYGLNEYAKKHVQLIEERSKGRIKINFRYGDEVVPCYETWDACGKGIIDAGHACNCYTFTKVPASALFCSAPSSLSSIVKYLWNTEGGGLEMLREMMQKSYNVMVFPSVPFMAETFLYTKKPFTSVKDLQSLKVRSAGIRGGIFKQAGVSVTSIPMGEIIPSLDKGVIDGTEICDVWTDSGLGLLDVTKYIYFTRYPMGGVGYLLINLDKWKQLPPDLKEVVESASRDTADLCLTRLIGNNFLAWEKAKGKGKILSILREDVDKHMDAGAKAYYADRRAKDPLFDKVLTSMETFNKKYTEFEPIAASSLLTIRP